MTKYQIVFVPSAYESGECYSIEKWKPLICGWFTKKDKGEWEYVTSYRTLEAARDALEKLKHNPYDTAEF